MSDWLKAAEKAAKGDLKGAAGAIGGKDVKDAIKTGETAVDLGKKAGEAVDAANTKTVKIGEASEFAKSVETFMKDNGLKVTENGTISAIEAAALKKHIEALTKDVPALKGQVTFGKDGEISFTPKGLELLEIKTTEPKKDAADVARDTAGKAADGASKVIEDAKKTGSKWWEKAKDAARDLNKCNTADHPEYGSQACVDARAKQSDRGQGRQ